MRPSIAPKAGYRADSAPSFIASRIPYRIWPIDFLLSADEMSLIYSTIDTLPLNFRLPSDGPS